VAATSVLTAFPEEIAALDNGAFDGACQRSGALQSLAAADRRFDRDLPVLQRDLCAQKHAFLYAFRLRMQCVEEQPGMELRGNRILCSGNQCQRPPRRERLPSMGLYDNGMGGAPNHRCTTSIPILDAMIAAGWVFEGNGNTRVFACVPQ
jgi:hypothetical protein